MKFTTITIMAIILAFFAGDSNHVNADWLICPSSASDLTTSIGGTADMWHYNSGGIYVGSWQFYNPTAVSLLFRPSLGELYPNSIEMQPDQNYAWAKWGYYYCPIKLDRTRQAYFPYSMGGFPEVEWQFKTLQHFPWQPVWVFTRGGDRDPARLTAPSTGVLKILSDVVSQGYFEVPKGRTGIGYLADYYPDPEPLTTTPVLGSQKTFLPIIRS